MLTNRNGLSRVGIAVTMTAVALIVAAITFGAATLFASGHRRAEPPTSSDSQHAATTESPAPSADSVFACPMHCEPGKTFAPGAKCPICRMATEPVSKISFTVVATVALEEHKEPTGIRLTVKDPTGLEIPASMRDALLTGPSPLIIARADLASAVPATLNRGVATPISPEPHALSPGSYAVIGTLTFAANPADAIRPPQPFAARFTIPANVGDQTSADSAKSAHALPTQLTEDFDVVYKSATPAASFEARIRCNGRLYYANQESLFRLNILRFPLNASAPGSTTDPAPALSLDTFSASTATSMILVSQDLRTLILADRITDPAHPIAKKSADFGNGEPTDALFTATFPAPGLYRAFITLPASREVPTDPPMVIPFTFNARDEANPDAPAAPASPSPNADPSHQHHH